MIHQPLHPGKIVRETCVEATGLTITETAKKLGIDRTTFSRLINGHMGISAEMAIRLGMALGTSPTLWLNLQKNYDLWKASESLKYLHIEKFKEAA